MILVSLDNLLEILIFTLRNFTQLPILRYLDICNVLYIWHIRAIPTYRVYQLYDSYIILIYEHLTISPVAAQCNGACGKRSSIEYVHIDQCCPQKSWRWRLRSTLNLGSDRFRCFNRRDELDSTVFLPNFRLVTLLRSRAGQPL